MSMPFYVSPEQVMTDKAEFARKGVARGKPSLVLECDAGILMMAENLSTLSKIGEIYDRDRLCGSREVQRVRPAAKDRRPLRRHQRLRVQSR